MENIEILIEYFEQQLRLQRESKIKYTGEEAYFDALDVCKNTLKAKQPTPLQVEEYLRQLQNIIDNSEPTTDFHKGYNRGLEIVVRDLKNMKAQGLEEAAVKSAEEAAIEYAEGKSSSPVFREAHIKDFLAGFQYASQFQPAQGIDISDAKQLRNYFGENSKTPFEHRMFTVFDSIIKKSSAEPAQGTSCIDPLFDIRGCDMPKGSCSKCGIV